MVRSTGALKVTSELLGEDSGDEEQDEEREVCGVVTKDLDGVVLVIVIDRRRSQLLRAAARPVVTVAVTALWKVHSREGATRQCEARGRGGLTAWRGGRPSNMRAGRSGRRDGQRRAAGGRGGWWLAEGGR